MKDVRFYAEHSTPKDKRARKGNGNVLATFSTRYLGRLGPVVEALGAVSYEPNSPVASTGVSGDHLHRYCRRISEAEARKIHPALFERLDQE
jgi:hypothetical protein